MVTNKKLLTLAAIACFAGALHANKSATECFSVISEISRSIPSTNYQLTLDGINTTVTDLLNEANSNLTTLEKDNGFVYFTTFLEKNIIIPAIAEKLKTRFTEDVAKIDLIQKQWHTLACRILQIPVKPCTTTGAGKQQMSWYLRWFASKNTVAIQPAAKLITDINNGNVTANGLVTFKQDAALAGSVIKNAFGDAFNKAVINAFKPQELKPVVEKVEKIVEQFETTIDQIEMRNKAKSEIRRQRWIDANGDCDMFGLTTIEEPTKEEIDQYISENF